MDKYMKAQDEWLEATADNVMARTIPNAFRWYENKYLAEALTAAVEMRMHASYTDAMLEEKREKKTCEWRRVTNNQESGFRNWKTACREFYTNFPETSYCSCGRRIVEVRDEK